ncbi:hypothetical protein GCM10010954_27380 [Halobacillus andaensis]|uniref:Uncharacterized protein n=1 Tax=Halobacillus andaensis TaxID=1176239 RepID=A0A917B9K6_HALAA|nr:hypothetical protein [Halobacillus andaensis]MBP2005676.1 hypothetical protein [Halobacillus andaensis]GGF26857.1 hypothetical protein GCM10010954_27380 [Halobacillus andaensis]
MTSYSDMEQYRGNFSNAYREGTKYFSIEGISTEEAIAVQEEDGRFIKAHREGEYTYGENEYWDEDSVFASLMITVLGLLLVIFVIGYFVKKRN